MKKLQQNIVMSLANIQSMYFTKRCRMCTTIVFCIFYSPLFLTLLQWMFLPYNIYVAIIFSWKCKPCPGSSSVLQEHPYGALRVHIPSSSFNYRNTMLDFTHCLKYIWYTRRFGSWLYSRLQVIVYHCTDTLFCVISDNGQDPMSV
jgi:hypothetical protein